MPLLFLYYATVPILCLLCLFGITRGLLQAMYAVQTGVFITNVLDKGLGLALMLRSGLVFICRHIVFRLTLLLVTLPALHLQLDPLCVIGNMLLVYGKST